MVVCTRLPTAKRLLSHSQLTRPCTICALRPLCPADLSVSQNPSGTLPLSPAGPGPDPTAPPPSHTAELPPASAPDASLPTTTSTRTPTPTDATPLTTTTTTAPGKPLPPWLAIDPAHHAALETLLGRIAEALPRLIPNLTLKSRVEAIPLLLVGPGGVASLTALHRFMRSSYPTGLDCVWGRTPCCCWWDPGMLRLLLPFLLLAY